MVMVAAAAATARIAACNSFFCRNSFADSCEAFFQSSLEVIRAIFCDGKGRNRREMVFRVLSNLNLNAISVCD